MVLEESKNIFIAKNRIGIDLEKALFPLTLTQYVILCPKYYLRQNNIRPNSVFTNFILCCITLTIFICFLYFSYKYLTDLQMVLTYFLTFLFYFEHSVYAVGYFFNVIFLILQSHVNVKLIIDIQMINKHVKIHKHDIRRIVIGNWIFCLLLFLFYILNTYVQVSYAFTTYVNICLSLIVVIPWDVNVVYAARMTYLLRKQTESWTLHLNDMLKAKYVRGNDKLEHYLWQSLFKAYSSIIETYSTCEKITEIPIVYHLFQTFAQFITNIQTLIQFKDLNGLLALCVMWTVKHALLLAMICFECENLYMSLKNSQKACLTTAYRNIPVPGRQYCKRLRKEGRKKLQPMTAKGLFSVNAALPLHLSSILVSYTVVLLQFNFL